MPGRIAKIWLIPIVLAMAPAVTKASDAPNTGTGAPLPQAGGSSVPVPPGKVMLPPLPLAKMPDTTMPKEPNLAPLPGAAPQQQPGRVRPGGS